MKYLVVFDTYSGKYYKGQFTNEYETLDDVVRAIKENENSISLKVRAVYKIDGKLDIEGLKLKIDEGVFK